MAAASSPLGCPSARRRQHWAELEASANPFAVVLMAHLQTQRTRHQPLTRLQSTLGLIRHLYRRGFTRQIILDVFRFVDWIMALPPELDAQFQTELAQLEAETHMPPYVTTIERSGIAKGLQQGVQQEAVRILTRQLTRRFGPLPAWAEERLAQASTLELEEWADRVFEAARLEDIVTPAP